MNATPLVPIAVTALIAACTGALLTAVHAHATEATATPDARRIVDLATVTVRPDPQDLAFYRAGRIVDLAAVTVRPEAEDLQFFLSSKAARMDDLAAAAGRPASSKAAKIKQAVTRSAQRVFRHHGRVERDAAYRPRAETAGAATGQARRALTRS